MVIGQMIACVDWIGRRRLGDMAKKQLMWLVVAFLAGVCGSVFANMTQEEMQKRVIGGPYYGKAITAEQFLVVDEDGRTRAVMAMYGASGPAVRLYDENGKARISLDLNNGSATIAIMKDGEIIKKFDEKDLD